MAQYVAKVHQWARMEREASAAAAQLFRSHFLDRDLAVTITGRLLPSIESHVAAVTAYTPSTPEVRKIHERYAHAWRRLLEGFQLINEGMREDDAKRLAQGRRRIEVWQEELLNIAAALHALVEEVGLTNTESAARGAPHVGA